MISEQEVLQQAAADGSLDPKEWPRTLDYILKRLDEVISEFPKPVQSTDEPSIPSVTESPRPSQNASGTSHDAPPPDKENAPPSTPTARPPVPTFPNALPGGATPSSSQETTRFPDETLQLFNSIKTSLSNNFPKEPPHTIQRLAELVLEPKRRYRFLPPYLRALDRVVSVLSPTTLFPLPAVSLSNTTVGLLNGTAPASSMLGSDESLGGALLTPIPWLRDAQRDLVSESTEMVDGPHGAGRIETVSVMNGTLTSSGDYTASGASNGDTTPLRDTGPVTQGELLRQEQEAGVVLSNPHTVPSQRTLGAGEVGEGAGIMESVETDDEIPHARGPATIGVEDMGPQSGPIPGADITAVADQPAENASSEGGMDGGKDDAMTDVTEPKEAKEEQAPSDTGDAGNDMTVDG